MNKTLKAVVRTDKIEATEAGRIHHIRLGSESQNGKLVIAGDIEPTNLDVRAEVLPTEGAGSIALVADPVKNYDECDRNSRLEHYYSMAEGHVARAYKIVPTDVYSVTKEAISNPELLADFKAETTVLYAVADTDGLHKLVADEPAEGFYAKVVDVEPVGGRRSLMNGVKPREYVILDVKNN